jgi:enediyne biosynthesis protein E4
MPMLTRFIIPILFLAAAQPPPFGPIRFEDVTRNSGITFTHSFGAEQLGSLLESTGAGAVWFDYNNDGYQDLFVVSGRTLAPGMHPYPLHKPPDTAPHNHLYRNNRNGTFTDVTVSAGLATDLYSIGAVAADFDNDGNEDLLVTGYGRVILYRNKGDGTFEDVTVKAGLKIPGWSIGAAWLDYDRDGCVDLFVGRYVKFDPDYRAFYYPAETNVLLHSNCDGTFSDVTAKAGIAGLKGRAMGVTAADFDGDGYPDIYVANDKSANFLLHNQHDGTFREIAVEAGVAFGQNGENTSAMGPVFADFFNDGKVDLWVTDSKYNRLYRNMGAAFDDITESGGISQLAAQYASWGTGAQDFDNDGLLDIFIVHGGLIHMIPQEHAVFRNAGNGKFVDVSSTAGPFFNARTGVKSVGRGAAFADYDNDGKVDAFLVNLGSPGILLRNTSPSTGHWIGVRLVGKKSNRDGIGAQIEVIAGTVRQRRERIAGSGYLSQDDGRVHFGLGSATVIDKLTVTWPSGTVQTLDKVPSGRVLTVEER